MSTDPHRRRTILSREQARIALLVESHPVIKALCELDCCHTLYQEKGDGVLVGLASQIDDGEFHLARQFIRPGLPDSEISSACDELVVAVGNSVQRVSSLKDAG